MNSSESSFFERLERDANDAISAFPGVAGFAFEDLTSGVRITVNESTEFPTASTIKMHILAQLLCLHERGEFDLDERIVIDHTTDYPGSGVLTYLDSPVELTRRDVANLMILVSDNTATNLCIDWATYEGVNGLCTLLGLTKTRLQRKMQDHHSVAEGHENLSTPADLLRFLRGIYDGSGLSASVNEELLRILSKPKRGYMTPGLPEDLVVANKAGGMSRVRNDAGIVRLDRRPYSLCIMSKYGRTSLMLQERFVADVGVLVHDYMTVLDTAGPWGQGAPLEALATIALPRPVA